MKDLQPALLVHIDMDSPLTLMRFHGIKDVSFSQKSLEEFYSKSIERIIDLLDRKNMKAAFFLVGKELEGSELIQKKIRSIHDGGHEIENHTYTHPFGLTHLSEEEIKNEITKCSEVIKAVTGSSPIGFRAPGYNMDTKTINIVRSLGFSYDASGFWSILNPIFRIRNTLLPSKNKSIDLGSATNALPSCPYSPDSNNWQSSISNGNFFELPLPRGTAGLPFYNNFNLYAPGFYSKMLPGLNKKFVLYLFHAIEFVDLSDDIPKELAIHPNVKTPAKEKIRKSEKILDRLLKCYEFSTTRNYIQKLNSNQSGNKA